LSAASDLEFLRKIQRLLSEGEFVATYKFALLQALADLSVEGRSKPGRNGCSTIALNDIAEKFIEYYWRQAIPYAPDQDQGGVLKQNTGKQAAVINAIVKARSQYFGSVQLVRQDAFAWQKLVGSVIGTIKQQPLWKLQMVGKEIDEFIYRQDQLVEKCVQLLPGVSAAFRSYHGLISNLIQGGWLGQVRRVRGNRILLGERGDLVEFLFGSERKSLDGYREVMRNYQAARCFYCGREVKGPGHADHFVPWSRYPVDLGHNFVFSHPDCNRDKSDLLAHPEHLTRWRERHLGAPAELEEAFNFNSLVHDVDRSRNVASWAYEHGEQARVHTYLRKGDHPLLDGSWRAAMGGLQAVAETPADYD
jgi:5-methylcytosine-specific restriction endonuclease McrA